MRDRIRDGSHSSRRPVAEPLKQPTRAVTDGEPSRRETRRCKHALPLFGLAPGGVYHAACCYQQRGALLPHPFTLTAGVPRCRAPVSGLLSVALSLDFEGFPSRRAGVTRHPCFVEPGLSSAKLPSTRLPGPLAGMRLAGQGARRNQNGKSSPSQSSSYSDTSRAKSNSNSNAPTSPSSSPSMIRGRQRR